MFKTVAQIASSFNNLLVNKKLASVNINVADLLNGNYILLLFVVLALGLCLGKLRLGSVQLGNSIGVLVVSLLLGQQHFSINTDALNLGFMLFIFCVGVEAGPNFFSIFFRDGKNYLMLALVNKPILSTHGIGWQKRRRCRHTAWRPSGGTPIQSAYYFRFWRAI